MGKSGVGDEIATQGGEMDDDESVRERFFYRRRGRRCVGSVKVCRERARSTATTPCRVAP